MSLEPDTAPDRRLRGVAELREALGSELMVHFTVEGTQAALTEDVKELAAGRGRPGTREPAREQRLRALLVGRFGARASVEEGKPVEVAVDTRSLHFFDPETSEGIYDETKARKEHQREGDAQSRHRAVQRSALAGRRARGRRGRLRRRRRQARARLRRVNTSVSGTVTFWGIWAATEQKRVPEGDRRLPQAVPERHGHLHSRRATTCPTVLSTAIAGGNPPDMADIAQPGLDEAVRAAAQAEADHVRAVDDRQQLLTGVGEPGQGQRQAVRAPLQGVQQVDPLVQRERPQAGRCQAAEDVVADDQRRQDDQGVRNACVLALWGERLDPHRHLREHLSPHVGAEQVRRALGPPDQVDRLDGDQGAPGHGDRSSATRGTSTVAPAARSRPTTRPASTTRSRPRRRRR